MTGENPAAAWQYSNELGAARLIIETGGIDKLVSEAMGGPVHPSQAGRGDVVLAELDRGPTIGVCLGRDCAFPADVGVTFRHRSVATQAWKVR
jgi:anthranilate/para-aminobenzoate synthase component II